MTALVGLLSNELLNWVEQSCPSFNINRKDIDLEQIHANFSKANFPPQITENKIKNSLRNHKFDIHIPCRDAETSEGRTKLEYDAIELVLNLYMLCRGIRGLENLKVDYYAEETGVGETVRIVGETTLTAEDYINENILGIRFAMHFILLIFT